LKALILTLAIGWTAVANAGGPPAQPPVTYFGQTSEQKQIESLLRQRSWLLQRIDALDRENKRLRAMDRWWQDPTMLDAEPYPKLKTLQQQLAGERERAWRERH